MSWHRSLSARDAAPFETWTPSLTPERGNAPSVQQFPGTFAEPNDNAQATVSLGWRCTVCDSASAMPVLGGWECADCGSMDFYDVRQTHRTVTDSGTWLYMPHAAQVESSPSSSSRSARRRRRRQLNPGPHGPPDHGGGERAESEIPTNDPVVEPSIVPSSRSVPVAAPPRPTPDEHAQVRPSGHLQQADAEVCPQEPLLEASGSDTIVRAIKKARADEIDDWNLKKGPEPGLRWRTGQHPQPPSWRYDPNDLRAFAKFEKKVRIWQIQMQAYASPADQALLLYGSLTGDAEQELEHMSIEEVHKEGGIDLILQKLQTPFEQRTVFQKRKFIHEYEVLKRFQGEVMRNYISRFRRALRNLKSVGIEMTSAYDSEALGSRLLDRSGLSAEAQRLVLVGTHQSLNFEQVAEALTLQYPDFRGPPPTHQLSKGGGKGKDMSATATSSSSSTTRTPFSKRSLPVSKVYVAGANDSSNADAIEEEGEPEDNDTAPTNEDQDQDAELPSEEFDAEGDPQADDDAEEDLDLAELSHVLTVTAKKLSGITLGRKYTTKKPANPQTSANIAKKKMNSHCMACGQKGHWKGDANCPVSQKPSSSTGYKADNKFKPGAPQSQKSQALTVVHHDHGRVQLVDSNDYGNLFTCGMVQHVCQFQVHEVQAFSPTDFIGKLILDSGCQRNCCGTSWFQAHDDHLRKFFSLSSHQVVSTAESRAYIPVGVGHQRVFLLGAAVLDAHIPLLGSHQLLEDLQAIISLPDKTLRSQRLEVTLPIDVVSGHLVVDIFQFPQHVRPCELLEWKQFSQPDVWIQPDPNSIFPSSPKPSMVQFAGASTEIKEVANQSDCPAHVCHAATMDDSLEEADVHASGLQEECVHHDDERRAAGHHEQKPYDSGRSARDGVRDRPSNLRASEVPPVRQSHRPLRPVPEVREEVEMASGPRDLVRFPWISKLLYTVAAIAVSVLNTGGAEVSPQSQGGAQGISCESLTNFDSAAGKPAPFSLGDVLPGRGPWDDSGRSAADAPRHPGEHGLLHPRAPGRSPKADTELRDRIPASQPRRDSNRGGGRGGQLRLGHRRRITGDLNNAVKVMEAERNIFDALPTTLQRPSPNIDIFELFAGSAKFTTLAGRHHLNALQPLDLQHGPEQDLKNPALQQEVREAVKKYKPWAIIMGLDCRLWSIFNENLNFSERKELLSKLRDDEKQLVRFACELALLQHQAGRFFLIENPQRSRLWTLKEILQLLDLPQTWLVTLDTGAFGANIDGNPIIKPMNFLGNIPHLDQEMCRRLDAEERLQCTPIQGVMTKRSQEYPDDLVHLILKHLRKAIHLREPCRFAHFEVLAVAQPVSDLSLWNDILDFVNRNFERSSKRPFNIDPSTEMGQKICDLVRMNAVRIQCAYAPTTRRIPTSMAFNAKTTHRAALLQYNDGTRELEVDDIGELQMPKQRFDKPVRVAIFMYGEPRQEPDPQPRADQHNTTLPLADLPTDITFPNLPHGHGISLETRRTVARLHLNLGHPSQQELMRMVAYYGGAPANIMTAIQHLKCSTCDRLRSPQPPRPATMPKFVAGQFGDEIQGDIFYVRILTAEAIPVLGLVDKATGYHQAAVCQTRNASETFQIMLSCWFKPFGLPFKIMLDPDTAFRGECQRQIESLGVLCEFCPAECHWMIGMVERRNAVLRCVLEKLIDQFAAYTADQLEQLLAPALHAINSSTFTRGRTAYQAVFGRVPRLPGGMLTDNLAIASSPSTLEPEDNLMAKGEIIRSEAQKYLIDLNVNQQFRRAILRRTRNTRYQDLLPGQTCAFWRWSRKGQRKRGAWAIARFLSWDPSAPTKLAWLRTGNTTVLVSAEQLRGAMGFESWCPSTEDISALKSASKSFTEHLLEDETGPPAPEETFADEIIPPLEDVPPTLTAPPTPLPVPQQQQQAPHSQPTTQQGPQLEPNYSPSPIHQQTQQSTNLNINQQNYQQTNVYQRLGTPPRHLTRQQSNPPTPGRARGRSRSPKPVALDNFAKQLQSIQAEAASSSNRPTTTLQQPFTTQRQAGEEPTPISMAEAAEDAAMQQQQPPVHEPETPVPTHQGAPEQQPSLQQPDDFETPVLDHTPATSAVSSQHGIEGAVRLPEEPPVPGVISISSGEVPGEAPPMHEAPGQRAVGSSSHSQVPSGADEPLPTLPQKRPFDNMFTIINNDGNLHFRTPLHDGSPDLGFGAGSKNYFEAYASTHQRATDLANTEKDGYDTDSTIDSDDDMEHPPTTTQYPSSSSKPKSTSSPPSATKPPDEQSARLTRQEMKQLDRELPWREIWKMPSASVQKFLQAIEKEANSWSEWNSIRPLSPEEIAKVKGDPILRKRILRSRAAYRDKNRNQGELRAKCRIVALGHQDPDLYDITRSSPTPGRATEMIVYLVAVSGLNKEFNETGHAWRPWLGDAATAFLQGRQPDDERKLPLFLRRPQDPLIDMTPFWKTEIYQVTGNIYGLPNAPYLWTEEVVARLTELGYRRHDFDRMLFCLYDSNNELVSIVMCYVDDFLGAHREDHNPEELFNKFRWGERSYFAENEPKTFKGKELTFVKNDKGRFVLNITMQKFLDTVDSYQMPRGRLQKSELLTAEEQREFRSIAGCLQWLGSQARPDVSPAISLCNHGQQTTIHDLRSLAETLQHAKDTSNLGMVIQDVPFNKHSVLMTYTDASWANAAHSASQMGVLILVTTPDVTSKTAKGAIVDWRSARSPRVCRSTLAAEACAADEGSDRSDYLNLMMSELFYNEPSHVVGCRLDRLQATDAKSLYDAIIATNPSLSEKRSLVNIRAIQECLTPQQTRWIPTEIMWADGLTKLSPTLRWRLLQWLQNPKIQLIEDEDPKKKG